MLIRIILLSLLLLVSGCFPLSDSNTPATSTQPAPSPTNTALPTQTSTPVPAGPCDNPLVPLAIGNQWVYRAANPKGESEFALKSLERRDAGNIITMVEFTDKRASSTIQEQVVCQDGAIENFPLFVMSMLFSGYLKNNFNTYHDTGIYAPAYNDLVKNNWRMSWQVDYLTEDEAFIENPMGGSDLVVLQSTPMQLSFQTDGEQESISTPAGAFPQALKVSHVFSLLVSLTIPGGATSGKLTIHSTQWYAIYLGLVRARIESATLSMAGTDLSVPFQSEVELVNFIPGD